MDAPNLSTFKRSHRWFCLQLVVMDYSQSESFNWLLFKLDATILFPPSLMDCISINTNLVRPVFIASCFELLSGNPNCNGFLTRHCKNCEVWQQKGTAEIRAGLSKHTAHQPFSKKGNYRDRPVAFSTLMKCETGNGLSKSLVIFTRFITAGTVSF